MSSGTIQLPLQHLSTVVNSSSQNLLGHRIAPTRVRPEKPNNNNNTAFRDQPWRLKPRVGSSSLWTGSRHGSGAVLQTACSPSTGWLQEWIFLPVEDRLWSCSPYLNELLKPECNHLDTFPHPHIAPSTRHSQWIQHGAEGYGGKRQTWNTSSPFSQMVWQKWYTKPKRIHQKHSDFYSAFQIQLLDGARHCPPRYQLKRKS